LLFGQFTRARSLALLVLACGYLFDALIIIPHALTFPASLRRKGCLGPDRKRQPDFAFGTAASPSTALFYFFKGILLTAERSIGLAWGRAPVIIVAPGYLNWGTE
jgi:hypothetical protein